MNFINYETLLNDKDNLKKLFNSKKPFRYLTINNFFLDSVAEDIYNSYPIINLKNKTWDGTTYLDQKNKFTKSKFEKGSFFDKIFNELNSLKFLNLLSEITSINNLLSDEELFGGGLHQSINGAYLNVHIDYNIHPTTKFHRRCNLIIYMNKKWNDVYNGHLELWDFDSNKKGELLEKISPLFNKAVIFETNEISYHGHPSPLNTPEGINRKSIATYYYTKERPESEINIEHNTIYKNTSGIKGELLRFKSGVKALFERLKK